jgi:GDPmannose 4,6-dehydratase
MENKQKTAVITGYGGQDAYYLSKLLIMKGYRVIALARKTSQPKEEIEGVEIVEGDLLNRNVIVALVKHFKPDEFYNLGAQSHVGYSFREPIYTAEVTGMTVLHILEAIKQYSFSTRFYQASTSELFGEALKEEMDETTRFNPVSPYAIAKQFAHYLVKAYRSGYGMHLSSGILFNHESPKRGPDFVTQKIVRNMVLYSKGKIENFSLGNVESRRDWGHARDYVRAMHLMLQQKRPDDYVIATGETHSVKEFVDKVAECLGLKTSWIKNGSWTLFDQNKKKTIIKTEEGDIRPNDVNYLKGNYEKAQKILGWQPLITFDELVKDMVFEEAKKH